MNLENFEYKIKMRDFFQLQNVSFAYKERKAILESRYLSISLIKLDRIFKERKE